MFLPGRIQGVSLPRCGHNLLVSHLQQYFGSQCVCGGQSPTIQSGVATERQAAGSNFHYCEYYYACRRHPCIHPQNTFQKSHDFNLKLCINDDDRVLVQVRKPMELLISWFEMRLLKGREVDSASGFRKFVGRQTRYLDGFLQRWVLADVPSRLVLDYDNYLADPNHQLAKVIGLFTSDVFDARRIAAVVGDIRPAKDNRRFRYRETADELRERFQSCWLISAATAHSA